MTRLSQAELESLHAKWKVARSPEDMRRFMNEGVPSLLAHADAQEKRIAELEKSLGGLVLLVEQIPEAELRLRYGGLKRARTALEVRDA